MLAARNNLGIFSLAFYTPGGYGLAMITLMDARDVLTDDRVVGVVSPVKRAFETWTRLAHPAFDSTTRARAIQNMAHWDACERLSDDQGVRAGEHRLQKYITFDERVLIRIKQFDRNLATRNYPTDQALEFVQQEQIDGFPPFDRLHVGYRLDISGTRLQDVFITLPTGRKSAFNAWVWQVLGDPIDLTTYGYQIGLFRVAQPTIRDGYFYEDYSSRLA
ncbi:MAG: hypothetical protein KC495_13760 [Dehalococcoidia bacterium]|nr:hypothetical protein [Dehalococcoidia bacterium]